MKVDHSTFDVYLFLCHNDAKDAMSSLYEILNVPRNASRQEIRKAYHKLAREYHPDRSKKNNSNELFQQVQSAYDVLSDDTKKMAYDRSLNFDDCMDDMLFDIETLMRDLTPGFTSTQSSTNIFRTELSVSDYLHGCSRVVEKHEKRSCSDCAGYGVRDFWKNSRPCHICDGTGVQLIFTCGRCCGRGRFVINKNKCMACEGIGHSYEAVKTEIDIPPHQENNAVIERNGSVIQICHAFEAGVVEREKGILIKEVPMSVMNWLCGTRTRVEFGTRKFDITTDGIFNITEPIAISQQLLVLFKLQLNPKEIKKLRRFAKVFRCILASKKNID